MKKIILIVTIIISCGVISYQLGHHHGFTYGQSVKVLADSLRDSKTESAQPEIKYVTKYIHGNIELVNVDEGGLFKTKYVQYLQGILSNTATFATAKDIEIKVDLYSKTNTKIGSQTLTIYEFIPPGKSINFKERITIPDKVSQFKYQIIGVKGE